MVLKRNIHYCENLSRLAWSTMNVVLDDRVVEDAVALFQSVGLLAIDNLNLALHDVDKLLTFVGRELELGRLLGVDVNHKRLHVATSLPLGQGVILHMLAGIGGTVRETDAAILLTVGSAGHDRSQVIVIVHKGAQTHTQCTGNLNERTK